MKIYFYFLVLVIALVVSFFTSCNLENSVTPEIKISEQKSLLIFSEEQSLTSEAALVSEKLINGDLGGIVDIDHNIGRIQIYGSLEVPSGAYTGEQKIKVELNRQYAVQDYSPSPFEFYQPLVLNLEYRNLDLRGIDPKDIDFYYIKDDFTFIKAKYMYIEVDVQAGVLKVVGAELPHFSRYGWAK